MRARQPGIDRHKSRLDAEAEKRQQKNEPARGQTQTHARRFERRKFQRSCFDCQEQKYQCDRHESRLAHRQHEITRPRVRFFPVLKVDEQISENGHGLPSQQEQ